MRLADDLYEELKKKVGEKFPNRGFAPQELKKEEFFQLWTSLGPSNGGIHYEYNVADGDDEVQLHFENWEKEGKGNFTRDNYRFLREGLIEATKGIKGLKWDTWQYKREIGRGRYDVKMSSADKSVDEIADNIIKGFEFLIEKFDNLIIRIIKNNEMEEYIKLLESKRNLILTGAPGVGKTYTTAALALRVLGITADWSKHDAVMDEYNKLLPMIKGEDGEAYVEHKDAQIFFTTFHQSLDYEDFVEGLKPKLEGGNITYGVEDGIFKRACEAAKNKRVVLIIDEINRGNVSKIFGELITLIESDKRDGGNHPLSAMLPYSKTSFSVPSNLYIIGTMNTTDRSTGTLDYALRRRFAFVTLKSDVEIVRSYYKESSHCGRMAVELFTNVKAFIESKNNSDYDMDDLMVGHSYFMADDVEELKDKLKYEVIPLIKEYINDGILNVDKETSNKEFKSWCAILAKV